MIQISHTRHVNVQEHPGVNSLAAQAAFLQRIGCVLIARDGEHERTACSQPRSPQPRAPGGFAGAARGLQLRRSCGWSSVCSPGTRAGTRVEGSCQMLALRIFTRGGFRRRTASRHLQHRPYQTSPSSKPPGNTPSCRKDRGGRARLCLPLAPGCREDSRGLCSLGGAPLPAASSPPTQTCPRRAAARS